jgi:hypothetical protein
MKRKPGAHADETSAARARSGITRKSRQRAQATMIILRQLGRSDGPPSPGPYALPYRVVRPR